MFKKLLLALALLSVGPALAQNPTCPTRPTGDSSNACASTAFVGNTQTNLLSSNNTWTGKNTFNPASTNAVVINPAAGTSSQAIVITQSGPTGVVGSFNYNTVGITNGPDVTAPGGGVAGWFLNMNNTNASSQGFVWGQRIDVTQSASTTQNGDFIAMISRCIYTGTNSGSGGCYGANPQGILLSGGSVPEVAGDECDARIDSGATATWQFGCSAVKTGTQSGGTLDAAFEIAAVSKPWINGIILNSGHGSAAIDTTGSIINSDGVAQTITNGINLPNWTITGNIFNFANYTVSGAGAVAAKQLTVGGSTVSKLAVVTRGINFNSANTDTPITIGLPTGVSNYQITQIRIANASASLTTATCGVFTATGAGGTPIVTSGTSITVNTASANTNNNVQNLTVNNATTQAYNLSTIYFRVQNAQGSAATADVLIEFAPL